MGERLETANFNPRRDARERSRGRDVRLTREALVQQLNAALATELRALERRKRRFFEVDPHMEGLREEFLEQSIEEALDTDRLVSRILELGGAPDFRGAEPRSTEPARERVLDIPTILREELSAQRTVIAQLQQVIAALEPTDDVSSALLEGFVRREQRFAERLSRHLVERV